MSLTPGLGLPFGIQPVNPVPVDSWSGPYLSIAEATGSIPQAVRFRSMEVRIVSGSTTEKYWFKDGVTDNDLVLFSIDISGLVTTASFNAFTSSYNTGSFTGSFIGTFTGSLNLVTNPGVTRVLTSDGTTQGAVAQSKLTFSNETLSMFVSGTTEGLKLFNSSGSTYMGGILKQPGANRVQFVSGIEDTTNAALVGINIVGVDGNGGATSWFTNYNNLAAGGGSPNYAFRKAGGTQAAPTAVPANWRLGATNFQAWDGSIFSFAGGIDVYTETLVSPNNSPGRIDFLTTPAFTAPAQRRINLSIRSDGRVQLGSVFFGNTITTNGAKLFVQSPNSTGLADALYIENSALSPLFVVRDDGRVSVGKTSPNATLDISGSVLISGSLVISGSTALSGSLNITGSTTQIGNNTLLGNTTLSGSIIISGSLGSQPTVQVYGNVTHDGYIRFNPVSTNIDQSISASYIYVSGSTNDLYFTQNGAGYNNTTRLRWLEGNIYTGLLTGGVVSGSVGGTTFNVSSGSGIIVTLNATTASREPYPTIKYVTWPSFTNITPTYLNIQDTTWLGIDNNGNLIQQANSFSNGQFDNNIQIGSVVHPNLSTISLFKTFTITSYGIAQQTYEFIRSFGAIKVSGHTIAASGSSLSVNRDSGVAFALGRNYVNNANKPSLVTDPSYNAPNIFRYYKSGSIFKTSAGTNTIDPSQYNTPSSPTGLSNVPGGQYTIQRLFYFPNQADTLGVYYGRTTYNSITNALANLPYETFEENNNTLTQAIFVAYLIVRGGTTNLSNTSDAQFIQAGTFRNTTSGGGGATSIALDDLSDVVISNAQPGDLFLTRDGSQFINSKQLTGSYALTGSLIVTEGITGSLFGTSSYAVTASYALNGGGGGNAFPYTGSAEITGSLGVTGSLTLIGDNTISGSQYLFGSLYLTKTSSPSSAGTIGRGPYGMSVRGVDGGSGGYFILTNEGGDASLVGISGTRHLNAVGNLGVGIDFPITPSARLHVKGSGVSSGTTFRVENSNATASLVALDNGSVYAYGDFWANAVYGLGSTFSVYADGAGATNLTLYGASHPYVSAVRLNTTTGLLFLQQNGRFTISSQTNFIGYNSGLGKLHIRGEGDSSSTNALYIENSSSINLLTVRDDGYINISGSLNVIGGITGSLLGTASYATQALSASYAPFTPAFPYTGSALITGSLGVTGSLDVTGSANILSNTLTVNADSVNNNWVGINTNVSESYIKNFPLVVKGNPAFDAYATIALVNSQPLIKWRGSYNSGNGAELYQNGSGTFLLNSNSSISGFGILSDGSVKFAFYGSSKAVFGWDIGDTPQGSGRVHIRGLGPGSGTNALYVENSATTNLFNVRDDGLVSVMPGESNITIDASSAAGGRIWVRNPNSNGSIGFNSYNTFLYPTELVLYAGSAIKGYVNGLGDLRFYNSSTNRTYMYISTTGLIGINKGTVIPNAELDVSGSVIISGSLTINTETPTLYTTKLLTSSAGSNTIYSAATSSYNGAFFDYVVSSGSNARAGQMMSVWNGSNVVYTETTTTDIGNTTGVALTVILSGANVLLTGSFADADWVMKTSVKLI